MRGGVEAYAVLFEVVDQPQHGSFLLPGHERSSQRFFPLWVASIISF